jgi:hypothetical protein
MPLAIRHKMKTESWIDEKYTLMDYWDRISSKEPITPRCHASEVVLLLDFEN